MPLLRADQAEWNVDDFGDIEPPRGGEVVFQDAPEFGPWLRKCREAEGLSLRRAARRMGISYSNLHRLETGGSAKPPALEVLQRIARLFREDPVEVMARAGVHVQLPTHELLAWMPERTFERVLRHPALQPESFSEETLTYYSARQKREVLELLLNLERYVKQEGATITDILEGRDAQAVPELRTRLPRWYSRDAGSGTPTRRRLPREGEEDVAWSPRRPRGAEADAPTRRRLPREEDEESAVKSRRLPRDEDGEHKPRRPRTRTATSEQDESEA